MPVWSTQRDWDTAQSDDGTVHESYGDYSAEDVQLGYRTNLPDLVAYYPFHEDSGSTANDVVNGYDGTINGCTLGDPGVANGTAYHFNPSNSEWVEVNAVAGRMTGDRTVAGWIDLNSLTNRGAVVGNNDASEGNGESMLFYDEFDNGKLNLWLRNDGFTTGKSTSTTVTNGLHFFAWTWNESAGEHKVYVDGGSAEVTYSTSTGTWYSDDNISIGQEYDSSTSDHIDGRVSNVMFFDAVKSQSFINDLYNTVTATNTISTGARTLK